MKSIPANPTGDVRRLSLAVREHVRWALANCDAILVAVSGGADSTALAAVVIDHCLRAGSTPHTLSVDHGIRPGSDREAQETCEVMASLGAQSSWVSVTVDAPGGPEASARLARRSALAAHAQTLGERVAVFLGHTMDDQAETVLLRLARGSGVGSLRAMSVRDDAGSIVWMRPLMNCRRSETLGVCRQLELPWVDDPSNKMDGPWRAADGSALRRSAVREQAIPSLANSLGMDPVPALARTAELSAADDEALDEWAEQVWRRAWEASAGEMRSGSEVPVSERRPRSEAPAAWEAASGTGVLRVAELKEIPQAVRMRVLHRYLSAVGAPSLVHLEEADALITHWSGQGPLSIPKGTLTRAGKGKDARLILQPLRLERERPRH